jgi:glycosyltransferase involved in cell wall biosynthesis
MPVRLANASHGHVLRRRWRSLQAKLFPPPVQVTPIKVCVVVPSFPAMGGILTVLNGIDNVTKDVWHIEYLTQFLEPGHENYIVHPFGTRRMTPLYFPFAWFYVATGMIKFLSLMRRGAGYHLLLPQDGIFSAAFAGLAGKLTGVQVLCIDHGDLSLFTPRNSQIYRQERIAAITTKNWPWFVRFAARSLLRFYWPSRYLAARIAAQLVDHYLIPGVPDDSIDEGCRIVGIPPERVTRFGSMIDMNHHAVLDTQDRNKLREQKQLPADSIVVTIACRLSAEKGLHIALESIDRALALLPQPRHKEVRVVIAGDGPLRRELEQNVRQRNLEQVCLFWGELRPDQVHELLSISDIFLYTSTRGACMAMAVLEAMAAGCAVIASTEPLANAVLLDEGRGIAVLPGNVNQTSEALLSLLSDVPLCHHMGILAREYICDHHNPTQFKQLLLAVTGCYGMGDQDQEGAIDLPVQPQEMQPIALHSGEFK